MSSVPLQTCTCPCSKHSTAATASPGDRSSVGVRQRLDSNSLAGSRQEFAAPLNLVHKPRSRTLPAKTRCLYSPLVESYNASPVKPLTIQRNGKNGGAILVSSSSVSFLKPAGIDTRSVLELPHEETFESDRKENEHATDENCPAEQDPIAAAHGDSSLLATGADAGHDLEARRSARYQPQTMSLTHSFRSAANQGVSCAIGVAGRPLANATKIGGPAGLMMGLAVAGLGIATAIQKAAETQPQVKLCSRCDGYGVECCDVCSGAGHISWEGKVHRTNRCPRCFGSRLKKCPRCDGCRVKKDNTPLLQKLKSQPKKK